MITYFEKRHNSLSYRILSAFIAFTFIFSLVLPPGYAQLIPQTLLNLPAPGAMVTASPAFTPALINGITIHPENPLQFDFIVNTGDSKLAGQGLTKEANKLIKYFLAALTVPEKELWVNLSPYEKDRIIPPGFGNTEMGRDLLAQDYILKQLTASLMYPEKELGKKFWDKIYNQAREKYGTTEIPMDTFNKVWIVPEDAVIYEQDNSAFVVKSHLKVMLEEDYMAVSHQSSDVSHQNENLTTEDRRLTTQIIKEIILPEIEKEVNTGETFASLRQIYNSTILAAWYKMTLKESLLGQVYVDQNKTKGIDTEDKQVNEKIYSQYLEAFKKGVYNYIKEDYDEAAQEVIPRKYFSGGANLTLTEATNVSAKPALSRFRRGTNGVLAIIALGGSLAAGGISSAGAEAMIASGLTDSSYVRFVTDLKEFSPKADQDYYSKLSGQISSGAVFNPSTPASSPVTLKKAKEEATGILQAVLITSEKLPTLSPSKISSQGKSEIKDFIEQMKDIATFPALRNRLNHFAGRLLAITNDPPGTRLYSENIWKLIDIVKEINRGRTQFSVREGPNDASSPVVVEEGKAREMLGIVEKYSTIDHTVDHVETDKGQRRGVIVWKEDSDNPNPVPIDFDIARKVPLYSDFEPYRDAKKVADALGLEVLVGEATWGGGVMEVPYYFKIALAPRAGWMRKIIGDEQSLLEETRTQVREFLLEQINRAGEENNEPSSSPVGITVEKGKTVSFRPDTIEDDIRVEYSSKDADSSASLSGIFYPTVSIGRFRALWTIASGPVDKFTFTSLENGKPHLFDARGRRIDSPLEKDAVIKIVLENNLVTITNLAVTQITVHASSPVKEIEVKMSNQDVIIKVSKEVDLTKPGMVLATVTIVRQGQESGLHLRTFIRRPLAEEVGVTAWAVNDRLYSFNLTDDAVYYKYPTIVDSLSHRGGYDARTSSPVNRAEKLLMGVIYHYDLLHSTHERLWDHGGVTIDTTLMRNIIDMIKDEILERGYREDSVGSLLNGIEIISTGGWEMRMAKYSDMITAAISSIARRYPRQTKTQINTWLNDKAIMENERLIEEKKKLQKIVKKADQSASSPVELKGIPDEGRKVLAALKKAGVNDPEGIAKLFFTIGLRRDLDHEDYYINRIFKLLREITAEKGLVSDVNFNRVVLMVDDLYGSEQDWERTVKDFIRDEKIPGSYGRKKGDTSLWVREDDSLYASFRRVWIALEEAGVDDVEELAGLFFTIGRMKARAFGPGYVSYQGVRDGFNVLKKLAETKDVDGARLVDNRNIEEVRQLLELMSMDRMDWDRRGFVLRSLLDVPGFITRDNLKEKIERINMLRLPVFDPMPDPMSGDVGRERFANFVNTINKNKLNPIILDVVLHKESLKKLSVDPLLRLGSALDRATPQTIANDIAQGMGIIDDKLQGLSREAIQSRYPYLERISEQGYLEHIIEHVSDKPFEPVSLAEKYFSSNLSSEELENFKKQRGLASSPVEENRAQGTGYRVQEEVETPTILTTDDILEIKPGKNLVINGNVLVRDRLVKEGVVVVSYNKQSDHDLYSINIRINEQNNITLYISKRDKKYESTDPLFFDSLPSQLPPIDFPTDKIRFYYPQYVNAFNTGSPALIFRGIMSPEERDALLKVSDNPNYQRAIEKLFHKSNHSIWAVVENAGQIVKGYESKMLTPEESSELWKTLAIKSEVGPDGETVNVVRVSQEVIDYFKLEHVSYHDNTFVTEFASSPVSKEEGARRIGDLFDDLREMGGFRVPEVMVGWMEAAGIDFARYAEGGKVYVNESFEPGANIVLRLGGSRTVVMTKGNLQDMTRDLIERDPDTAGNFLEELEAAVAHFQTRALIRDRIDSLVEQQEELKQRITTAREVITDIDGEIKELSREESGELRKKTEDWNKAIKEMSGLAADLRDIEKDLAEIKKQSEPSASWPVVDLDKKTLEELQYAEKRFTELAEEVNRDIAELKGEIEEVKDTRYSEWRKNKVSPELIRTEEHLLAINDELKRVREAIRKRKGEEIRPASSPVGGEIKELSLSSTPEEITAVRDLVRAAVTAQKFDGDPDAVALAGTLKYEGKQMRFEDGFLVSFRGRPIFKYQTPSRGSPQQSEIHKEIYEVNGKPPIHFAPGIIYLQIPGDAGYLLRMQKGTGNEAFYVKRISSQELDREKELASSPVEMSLSPEDKGLLDNVWKKFEEGHVIGVGERSEEAKRFIESAHREIRRWGAGKSNYDVTYSFGNVPYFLYTPAWEVEKGWVEDGDEAFLEAESRFGARTFLTADKKQLFIAMPEDPSDVLGGKKDISLSIHELWRSAVSPLMVQIVFGDEKEDSVKVEIVANVRHQGEQSGTIPASSPMGASEDADGIIDRMVDHSQAPGSPAAELLKREPDYSRGVEKISTDQEIISDNRVPVSSPAGVHGPEEEVGGINLDPALLDLQIKRDGNGVPLPLPMQPIEHMHIEGFLPIIINVTPITNLPMLLGLADTEQDADEITPAMKARHEDLYGS